MGAQNGSAWGRPQVSATFFVPDKNKSYTVVYPGQGKVDQSVVDLLKGLKPKDPVNVSIVNYLGKGILTSISAITKREGEDKPSVYVFKEKKTARTGQIGVELSKSLRSQILLLGGQDSSSQENPLIAAVEKLKPDDLVYAEIDTENGRTVVTMIEPYHPPLKGEFVKFNANKPGEAVATIEVRTDAGMQTYPLPVKHLAGRDVPSPKLRMAAERLRAGQNVELHVNEANNNTLIAIWLAQDQDEKKPEATAKAP